MIKLRYCRISNAFEKDIRGSIEAGLNAHLVKPMDGKKMIDIMRRFLASKTRKIEWWLVFIRKGAGEKLALFSFSVCMDRQCIFALLIFNGNVREGRIVIRIYMDKKLVISSSCQPPCGAVSWNESESSESSPFFCQPPCGAVSWNAVILSDNSGYFRQPPCGAVS